MTDKKPYIKVSKDGPYLVYGISSVSEKIILTDTNGISVKYGDGETFEIKSDPIALCRCGKSKTAPFCDGSHTPVGFDGTETASFEPILKNAERTDGPNLTLMDNRDYCAFARFCDAHGKIWNLVTVGDKQADKWAIAEADLCPSGRLLMFDKFGKSVDAPQPTEISTIEDSGLKLSGPLWIRGGIRVESADGQSYEVRPKQTLCRCGASSNKPFCNGMHAHPTVRFRAKKA